MTTPPREGFRAVLPDTLEIKERAKGDGEGSVLSGHFAVFNRWTEINSWIEGHFLERIAPGAFKKTFTETVPKVLFQHGRDNVVGDRPLGTIKELREDGDKGAFYEVDLFDTSYNADLIPGLRAGVYGASFRFRSTREEFEETPDPTDWNPDRLPLRTIKEAQVSEFGPVTWPAYEDATAAVRSISDDLVLRAIERDPERFARWVGSQDDLMRAVIDLSKQGRLSKVIDLSNREDEKPESEEKPAARSDEKAYSIQHILDAGFSPETTVMIVDDSERADEHALEDDAPVEESPTREVTIPETRRVEDEQFIRIGNLTPIPRRIKEEVT